MSTTPADQPSPGDQLDLSEDDLRRAVEEGGADLDADEGPVADGPGGDGPDGDGSTIDEASDPLPTERRHR
jgi:hypothetical protein